MMRNLLCLIIFCLINLNSFSQNDSVPKANQQKTEPKKDEWQPATLPKEEMKFKDRFYFGGNVGAWFGSTTYVNLQPLVGFKLTEKFSIGGGYTYNYFSQDYGGQKFTYTIYGSNAFMRYFILDNLFGQVGWDHLSVPDYYAVLPDARAWVDNILVGGGYRQPFAENGAFIVMVFYNANQTPLSPYPNPIIQIGFNLGF